MTTRFFIMGLPRSRTAWLANWFSQTHARTSSFCFHDGSRLGNITALFDEYQDHGYDYLGNSDSSIGFQYEWLAQAYPEAKWLLVERPLEDVLVAARRALGWMGVAPGDAVEGMEALVERHEEIKAKAPAERLLVLPFDELAKGKVLALAQHWLTPLIPFDRDRFRLVTALNVQVEPEPYMAAVPKKPLESP